MRLSELVHGLATSPASAAGVDPEVAGICADSRRAMPGDLFVAWVGERHDGSVFAADAIARGAVAVLAPSPLSPEPGVPWLTAAAPRALLGPLAARLYDHPDRQLTMIGVTGTNGKSTVVELVAAILDRAGTGCGVIGTLGYRFGAHTFAGDRTTPEASELFSILRRMHQVGAGAVAMEVSSHALDQGRVAGAQFDVAVFTNLSRDHFDFHGDFSAYFAAKRRLFQQLAAGGRPVINIDDPYGRQLAAELPGRLAFNPVPGGQEGDVRVIEAEFDGAETRAVLATPRGRLALSTPLLGRFNLANLVAAVAVAEVLELPAAAVAAALAAHRPLPGRLQPVDSGQPFPVYIDYAHTDAALAAALRSVAEMTGRRLVVVFGCGGDRDPGKRPLMGRVVGELAALPIVTSDNPRGEDPLAIIAAVRQGLDEAGASGYRVEPDRRRAIRLAIAAAGAHDAVVIAGKGHETGQIIGDRVLPFSDYDEAMAAIEERFGATACS